MVRIAVDAMGGDHAPAAIVDGAVAAARHLDIQISLVGAPDALFSAGHTGATVVATHAAFGMFAAATVSHH